MNGGSVMMKYGVGAVLIGLYAAVASWIVAGEGESYRKSLKRPGLISELAVASDPSGKPDPAPVSKPEPAPPPVATTAPAPVPSPTPVVVAAPQPTPPVAPVVHASSTPAKTKVEGPKLNPFWNDPFWNEPDQQKIWDFASFSAADERELGRTLHRMVLKDHAEIDAGPLPKRLTDAAKPYLAARTRKDVQYTFYVLDCPRMNVFSHPGGYVYVCKGLFDWIAEDEDYALGFILGHEIAHVDLGHAVTCMRDPEIKKNFKFGTSLFFYAALIPGGYLEPQDQEADRWAALQMAKLGKTRYEILAFLRRLEDYAKTNGFENRRKAPTDTPIVPKLDNHIRAHPIPRDRLDEVKAFIDRSPKL